MLSMKILSLPLSPEKDWEDIRKMPEHGTLMRDFGRLKPQYHGCNLQRYMAKHSIKSDTTAFQLVRYWEICEGFNFRGQ